MFVLHLFSSESLYSVADGVMDIALAVDFLCLEYLDDLKEHVTPALGIQISLKLLSGTSLPTTCTLADPHSIA